MTSKQNSDVMIGGVDMRSGDKGSLSETTRNLLDDKSSIHNDRDSMNDTLTRLGDKDSILNMSDGRLGKQRKQDVVIEEPSKEDGRL